MDTKTNTPFMTVKFQGKPLVKCFLERNFGTPVTIPDNHILYKSAIALLTKENPRVNRFDGYSNLIELNILKENYRFDGFSISSSNEQVFNTTVENYIRDIIHTNLDSLLISQEKQKNWKEKFSSLLAKVKDISKTEKATLAQITEMKRELEEHELNIKESIVYVVEEILGLDIDMIDYDTVRKNYYRYRKRKSKSLN
jgi:hypothetical protein